MPEHHVDEPGGGAGEPARGRGRHRREDGMHPVREQGSGYRATQAEGAVGRQIEAAHHPVGDEDAQGEQREEKTDG